MSLRETDEKIIEAVRDIQSRLLKVEGKEGREEEKSKREQNNEARQSAREERKVKQDLENFAKKQISPSKAPRYTNPERQREAVTRHTSYMSAPTKTTNVQTGSKRIEAQPIPFFVYKEGKIGKMMLLVESGFVKLPPSP
jgi:hypothetical protein